MKWNKISRARIAGVAGISLGLYMMLALNNIKGLIPLGIGILLLFWKF